MKHRVPIVAIAGFICLLLTDTRNPSYSSERGSAIHSTERPVSIAHGYGNLPMSFEPNQGQFDPQFKFGSQGAAYALLLNPTGATFRLHDSTESKSAELTIRFRGTTKQASIRAADPLPGIANYYYGRPEHWITRVPTYQRVVAENVYPGIDAEYYGNQGQFEYDFIVKPGALSKQIDVAFEGATKLAVA